MSSVSFGSIISRCTDDIAKIERAAAVYESGQTLQTGFAIYAQANTQLESKISELGKRLSQKRSSDPMIQTYQELSDRYKKLSDRVSAIVANNVPCELQRAIREDDAKQALAILALNKMSALPNGEMPLIYAIRCGSYETVKTLLDRAGLDISAKDHQNLTPIDHAFLSQDQTMIRLVLQSALGVKHPNIEGLDLLYQDELSSIRENFVLFRNIPIAKMPPAFQSAYLGELEEIKKFTKSKDFDVNAQMGSLGITPLHLAVLGGREAIVKHLLQAGAKKLPLNDGQTLLHLAVVSGNANLVRLFLETAERMDPNLPNQKGATPLHYAMLVQNTEVRQLLIQKGATPFIQTMKTTPYAIFTAALKEAALLRNPLAKDWSTLLSSMIYGGAASLGLSADYWMSPMMHTASQIGYLAPACLTMGTFFQQKLRGSMLAQGALSGIGMLFSLFPNEVKIAANLLPLYSTGVSAVNGLAACWRNRHVERFFPLLFHAGLHMFNVSFAINRLWWALDMEANRELETKWARIREDIDVFGPAREKLGLKPGFTQQECKQAYRKALTKAHPDKFTGDSDKAQLVRKAFDDLERCSYPTIPYDICEEKGVFDCLNLGQSNGQYLLNPQYPRHARIVFGLNYGHSLSALAHAYNQKAKDLGTKVTQEMITRLESAFNTLAPTKRDLE